MKLSRNDLARALGAAGFTEEHGPRAFAIAMRESGGDPEAHSAVDGGMGLFQIHPSHVPWLIENGLITKREDLFDPVVNARVVVAMMERVSRGES